MENHPIPQDITGFQFKLIGEMTVKQFAYLAIGVATGWFIIWLLTIIPFLIRLPFGLLFAGVGAAFAFLPFEGRPLDTMIAHFFYSFTKPTRFVFRKEETRLSDLYSLTTRPTVRKTNESRVEQKHSQEELQAFLRNMPKTPKNNLDQKELKFFQAVNAFSTGAPVPPSPKMPLTPPLPQPPKTNIVLPQPKPIIATQNTKTPVSTSLPVPNTTSATAQPNPLSQPAQNNMTPAQPAVKLASPPVPQHAKQAVPIEKDSTIQPIQKQPIKADVSVQNQTTPQVPIPANKTTNARMIPRAMAKNAGAPIVPEAPNLITGIVKDPRGNPLSQILVEVKDKDGNPIRAFKTNALGQFAAATSVLNGTYTIEFEDPSNKQKFEPVEILAAGEVIMPLEIISMDEREELRRSLFGQQPTVGAN